MQIQTVFKAGNSSVVAIPKDLMKELDLKPGQKVTIEKDSNNQAVVIKKATNKAKTKSVAASKEFERWWKVFIKDNKEILDELAVR